MREDHPSLALVDPDHLLDAIVFGCGPSVIEALERAPDNRAPASPGAPGPAGQA